MFFSPAEMMRLTIKTGMMVTEAQMAMGLRLMNMGTLWARPLPRPDEAVTEKLSAPDAAAKPRRSARKTSNVTQLAGKARTRKA